MKELKFLHITKCAGTTIENSGENWGKHDPNLLFWHQPLHHIPIEIRVKYDWFAVVRNPYTRLISEFYCQWGGPPHELKTRVEFNQYLKSQLKLITQDPWFRNGHFTPQYLYMEGTEINHLLHFETIHIEFNNLMKIYNLPFEIDKKEPTKNRFSVLDFDKDLMDLVHDVYAKDFELFGYKKKKEAKI